MLRTAPEEDEEVTTSSLSLDSRWEREEELLDMECCSVSPGQSQRRGWSIRRDQSSRSAGERLLGGAGPKSHLFCLETQPELQGHSGAGAVPEALRELLAAPSQ